MSDPIVRVRKAREADRGIHEQVASGIDDRGGNKNSGTAGRCCCLVVPAMYSSGRRRMAWIVTGVVIRGRPAAPGMAAPRVAIALLE